MEMAVTTVSSLAEAFTAGKAALLDEDIYGGTEKKLEKSGSGMEVVDEGGEGKDENVGMQGNENESNHRGGDIQVHA